MNLRAISWTVAVALSLIASNSLADITLVQDGAPRATIVVAKEAVGAEPEPTEATVWAAQPTPNKVAAAARDLQLYIEKMSGAKLPIVGDAEAPAGALVLVGRSALTEPYDARIPSGLTPTRDEEGYVILAEGDRLVLAGNDESVYHGTEYAVSAFLHRLGVRWYMPGDFGEVVPRRGTITVEDIRLGSTPDFKMRNWWGPMASDLRLVEYRWKIRNGMNPVLDFVTIPRDSSVSGVLPPPGEIDNAELAAVWGRDEHGRPNPRMPNLTGEQSVLYAAEKIKQYFGQHPEVTSWGIGADDGHPRDHSPETVKRNLGLPDNYGRIAVPSEMSATEEWMSWIQAVAKEVYKEFPDHIITTNGYANRNIPPLGIEPDPEIWIMFAAIWSDTLHAYDNPRSWQTLRQGQMIRQWAAMYDNVYMYNYMYYMLAGAGAPIPLAHKHMHDMPLYKKWGVVGFSNEGRCVRGETGVFPTYLYARMMWDADLDAESLVDEFFANWYGPAAAPARAFWEELERTMETTPWLGHEDRILPYVYSDELVARLGEHLEEAERLAADPWSKPRVLADRVTYEHLKAFLAMHRAEFAADFAEAARQAQRMIDVRKDATVLSRFYFDPDPRTGESIGFYYWGAVARRDYYQRMADLTTGKTGDMIAILPERAKFRTDPRDDGRFWQWYSPEFNEEDWDTILTTVPFYGQGYQDEQGYPYLGAIWYRMAVDAPAAAGGRQVRLYAPAVETEAWVWVNGRLVGHRPYQDAYVRPNPVDMDVTEALVPGQRNSIVIRVQTSTNASQAAAGMTSRAFLYSPKGAAD